MTRLPSTLYIILGNYGPAFGRLVASDIGIIDPVENMEDAADQLGEIERSTGCDGRVLELTFDISTNLPESVRDVTEDCVRIVQKRLAARGVVTVADLVAVLPAAE